MKIVKEKNNLINILILTIILLCFIFILPQGELAKAASPLADGKYEVPIDNDLPMGKDNFKDTVIVEKFGNNYYMTFTVLDSTAVKDIQLNIGQDKVGQSVKQNGKTEEYTFSLSEKSIQSSMNISGFVTGMKTNIDFNIKLKFSEAKKISDTIDNPDKDRPAIFVPTLSTSISDTEVEKGSYYFVPKIKAKLNGIDIPVKIKAYYLNQGNLEEVEIVDGKFKFDYIGEYHIIVRAESEKYKTLKGKNTFTELDVKILSKIGANSIAKISNDNGAVPEDTTIQASYVTTGEIFDKAANAMEKISDHFEVINIELFDTYGNVVNPTNNISLLLRANDSYNRNDIIVYRMDENGNISQISNSNYGRYIEIKSDKAGAYIVCVPGVEFVMPMWAIATITVVSVVIVIILVVILIVLLKKKKKQQQINDGTYVEKTVANKNKKKSKKQK